MERTLRLRVVHRAMGGGSLFGCCLPRGDGRQRDERRERDPTKHGLGSFRTVIQAVTQEPFPECMRSKSNRCGSRVYHAREQRTDDTLTKAATPVVQTVVV